MIPDSVVYMERVDVISISVFRQWCSEHLDRVRPSDPGRAIFVETT